MSSAKTRIVELEDQLKEKDKKLDDLRAELKEATDLVDELKEQVEDSGSLIDQWIDAFEMEQNERGEWTWRNNWVDKINKLRDAHDKLLKDWNRFVPMYNATVASEPVKTSGRPLQASEQQMKEVLRCRKQGISLRVIAKDLGLSFRTVQTIVGKANGSDPAKKRHEQLRKREFDRLRAAEYRRRQKLRASLPKMITKTRKVGDDLIKKTKGIGKAL